MKPPNPEEKRKAWMEIRSSRRAEFIKKGAEIKCPGKQRLARLLPEPVPTDLNCLRKKETAKKVSEYERRKHRDKPVMCRE
jgi:hypothetical protein